MKKGALVAAAIVVVLGGLSWLAWTLLFSTPPAPTLPSVAAAGAPATKPAPLAAPAEAEKSSDATATRAAEAIAPPPPPAPLVAEMPASYRKALSGVRGRLVEDDGKPVGGLEVELLEFNPAQFLGDFGSVFSGAPPKFPDLALEKTRAEADGTFALHGTHGSAPHAIGVDLGGARGTLRVIDRTLASGEVTDLGDVVLGACVTFKGKVADEDGKPVAGARVRATTLPPIVFQPGVADVGHAAGVLPRGGMGAEMVEFPDSLKAWESKLPLPTTKSADDGSFELKGVPQGLVTLVVDRDGFCGTFKGPTPSGKREREVGTIELSRGRTVRGTVVDAAGAPVAGAEVFGGVEIPVARLSILFKGSPTGADGRFAIDHLSPLAGSLQVVVRASPLQMATIQPVDDPARDVTVTLPGQLSLGVWLKHADGTPVTDAGVELWLNPTPGIPILSFAAPRRVADAQIEKLGDGHVAIHGLAAGRCELFGRVAGLARASVQCSVGADASEATLEFAPAATLAIEVVDAATQEPVEWADVTASADGRHEAPFVARRTDAKGGALLPELPAGKSAKSGDDAAVRVHVGHPAYAPQFKMVAPAASAATPVRFELTPGAAIHGRAHRGNGPLTDPVLIVFEFRERRLDVDDAFPRLAVPGLDGTFELKGLPSGTANWEAVPRLFGGDAAGALEKITAMETLRRGSIVLEEGKTAELDIDLDPSVTDAPAKVTGRVHVNGGRRPERLRLNVMSQTFGSSQHEPKSQEVDVRPDQPFSVETPPGWINVSLSEAPPDGANAEALHGYRGDQQLYQAWFELQPGQSYEIAPQIEFVSAKLLLIDADGRPVPHVGVNLNLIDTGEKQETSWRGGQSGDDGVVEIELPRPGRWRCQTQSSNAGRGDAQFDFPSTRVERVQLSRGVPCSGRIEIANDPGGDETFHLQFYRMTQGDGSFFYDSGSSVMLEKGAREFEIVGLDAGTYMVNLYGSRWSRDRPEITLTSAGRRDIVLKFRLEQPEPVKGDR